MRIPAFLSRLARDCDGNAVVEFAIAGPIFIGMVIGVFQAGVQVQNYNALRSVASDVNRYVVVEYQKGNQLTPDQIEVRAAGVAMGAPYLLNSVRFDPTVTQPTSRVTGAKEFTLRLDYDLPNWLQILNVSDGKMTYSQAIFVPA